VKFDLDLLLKKNPALGQTGNGQQAGQSGNTAAPGTAPSSTPNKGNPDDI
jgi:hypothetical protein